MVGRGMQRVQSEVVDNNSTVVLVAVNMQCMWVQWVQVWMSKDMHANSVVVRLADWHIVGRDMDNCLVVEERKWVAAGTD